MMMGKGSSNMPSKMSNMPKSSMGMDDSSDEDSDNGDDKAAKMAAMQNLLDGLSDLVGDDMKPYIDKAKQSMNLSHDEPDGDEMGSPEDNMQPKSGMDVTIGMGAGKPSPMDSMGKDSSEEDDSNPKGFLAILAKRMKTK